MTRTCQNCGARLSHSEEIVIARCPVCGSTQLSTSEEEWE